MCALYIYDSQIHTQVSTKCGLLEKDFALFICKIVTIMITIPIYVWMCILWECSSI